MRRKAAEAAEQAGAASSGDTPEVAAPGRASQTWAMLIKRVYEIDPLCCPKCQGQMKVIALHRAAAGRRDREDPAPLRAVALLTGTAGRAAILSTTGTARRPPTSRGS